LWAGPAVRSMVSGDTCWKSLGFWEMQAAAEWNRMACSGRSLHSGCRLGPRPVAGRPSDWRIRGLSSAGRPAGAAPERRDPRVGFY
jgi:hypothetical protein